MLKTLFLITSLAVTSFGATVPRPAGELPFEIPGQGKKPPTKKLLSSYRGKVVLVAAILTS